MRRASVRLVFRISSFQVFKISSFRFASFTFHVSSFNLRTCGHGAFRRSPLGQCVHREFKHGVTAWARPSNRAITAWAIGSNTPLCSPGLQAVPADRTNTASHPLTSSEDDMFVET